MRLRFNPPTHEEFANILNTHVTRKRAGGLRDITVFRPSAYRRGGGLFSILRSVAKTALPFFMKSVLPSIASAGVGVLGDMTDGRKFKESMKDHGRTAFNEVRGKIIRGGGRKIRKSGKSCKKKKCKKTCSRKKNTRRNLGKYKGDVFDMM